MSMIPSAFLRALEGQSLSVSPAQLEQLAAYVAYLEEVNQHLNLTAVRETEAIWHRHILDSLQLLEWIKADPDQRALDLGSGGGLPGIPLAICRPDVAWVLVDSVQKKARFLESCAGRLGLNQVTVRSDRAEVLGQDPAFREQFHLLTARAVARLPTLLELTVPLLRVRGRFLAMKGAQAGQEVTESRRAMERLHVRLQHERPTEAGGCLLVFKKTEPTPGKYPRAIGIPVKEPL